MTKGSKPPFPEVWLPETGRLEADNADTVPASLIDPYVAIADPLRPVEPIAKPKGPAVIDEMPRRDVEELNRALDQAMGVADSVIVTMKLSPREYRRLRDNAEATGQTEQMVLRDALFEYFDRRGQ